LLEWEQLVRDRIFVLLVVFAAASYLVLVSLFGLTGSNAPLAVIDLDRTEASRHFSESLAGVSHAFSLRPMTADEARAELGSGRLVGALTIPAGFSREVGLGNTVPLNVDVDNVNADLMYDLQRALPTAILGFGQIMKYPGLRVTLEEHDLHPRDIPFLAYVAVSGLALAAFMIAGALGALSVTREIESGTLRMLRLSPARMGEVLFGKWLASSGVSALAMAVVTAIVLFGYGVSPPSLVVAFASLLLCVGLFSALGVLLGAVLRRTFAVMPLLFGLAMPLYIDCGSMEPARFDGELLWQVAHLSPLYYAVGLLQWAFHGVRITPETVGANAASLVLLLLAGLGGATWWLLRKSRRTGAAHAPGAGALK
jgi:ABC-2 type transport system permease protein